jgi:hypothetical protein
MNHLRYYCIQFNHSSYAPLLIDGVGLTANLLILSG